MEIKYLLQLIYLFIVIRLGSITSEYLPDWNSLDSRPLPAWYDNAKVGIFIHWGVYSVPNYGDEWFWYNWKTEEIDGYEEYMKKNYAPNFTYQDFASLMTGELFNASEWASLFESAGAKYVVLTSKHHDGFSLWPSTYSNSWNSMDMGPHIDIVGELSNALRSETNITFGIYYSLYEWYNRMYRKDKAQRWQTRDYIENKVYPELFELIDKYAPEIIWSDGDWEAAESYWKPKEFLAWLYNESKVNETVVVNDRWGLLSWCRHGDFHNCMDRYNPGVLKKHKWENAFTIDRKAWDWRETATLDEYLTSEELIKEIVTTVSCNGNALVGVGPTRFGNIPSIFQERLRDMGHWLAINGEAIYDSNPWIYQNDTFTPNIWFTSKSLSGKIVVYATVLSFPSTNYTVDIFAINDYVTEQTKIELLGYSGQIMWFMRDNAIRIKFPDKATLDELGLKFAWTFKITGLKSDSMK
uniref:Putative alpha-L-fucosidase n=1 Tax=Culicoides sonorensis TaxID=179676 RepID=A0A336KX07_CULSO